jgi:DNA-binding NarL/FixJ family response regulator
MVIKILVVDDHEIVRRGLCRLIEGHCGWKVCGQAGDGKEAIEKTLALKPDVVLMDISMPIMNGIEATRQIRRVSPSTKILILSLHDDRAIATEAKEAGADAYVLKTSPCEALLSTIAAVLGEGLRPAHHRRLTPIASTTPAD